MNENQRNRESRCNECSAACGINRTPLFFFAAFLLLMGLGGAIAGSEWREYAVGGITLFALGMSSLD